MPTRVHTLSAGGFPTAHAQESAGLRTVSMQGSSAAGLQPAPVPVPRVFRAIAPSSSDAFPYECCTPAGLDQAAPSYSLRACPTSLAWF